MRPLGPEARRLFPGKPFVRHVLMRTGASLPLLCNGSSKVRKKLLHDSESDVPAHRDAEADRRSPWRVVARRQPRSGKKRAGRHSAEL